METLFELPEVSKANHRIRMMVGARKNRNKHDFYPTPEIATVRFLEAERFEGEIWEPACGDGAMSRVIERYLRGGGSGQSAPPLTQAVSRHIATKGK